MFKNKRIESLEGEIISLKEKIKEKEKTIAELKPKCKIFCDLVDRLEEMKEQHSMKVIFFDDTVKSPFEVPAIKAVQEYFVEIGIKKSITKEQVLWMARTFNTHYPVVSCYLQCDTRWKDAQKAREKLK